jgi:hypothetical protein
MSREYRNWKKQDPVEYFNEHYAGRITTRKQLVQEDHGLYLKLHKEDKLDIVLPDLERRDFSNVDPVTLFNERYAGRITKRSQLEKEDTGLYQKLRKAGKLGVVLPDFRKVRDFSKIDPVKYFEEHYAGRITTRKQLENEDPGLYAKLRKAGKLDDVLPDSVYRDFSKTDPVEFFKEHYAGKITSRSQLQNEDNVLYNKLRKAGKIGVVLPDGEKRDFSGVDLVTFFKEHYAGRITTRSKLAKEDPGLYARLRKAGKLDDVLPDFRKVRDFSKVEPVALFNECYAGKITTRWQLQKEDKGLYNKLRKMGKLDAVFPSDNKKQLEDLMDDFGGSQ